MKELSSNEKLRLVEEHYEQKVPISLWYLVGEKSNISDADLAAIARIFYPAEQSDGDIIITEFKSGRLNEKTALWIKHPGVLLTEISYEGKNFPLAIVEDDDSDYPGLYFYDDQVVMFFDD